MSEVTSDATPEQEVAQVEEVVVEPTPAPQKPVKPAVPAGYVPVAELGKERKKAADFEKKSAELEAKLAKIEARETKRGFLKDALKEMGENWTIESQSDLEDLVDALEFGEDAKDKVLKLVNATKRPKSQGPHIPMLGTVNQDQASPSVQAKAEPTFHDKLKARLNQSNA